MEIAFISREISKTNALVLEIKIMGTKTVQSFTKERKKKSLARV